MRAGAVTRMTIEDAAKPLRSPMSVWIGATVTPRDQSVNAGVLRSPVVWSGTVSTRLCPETTFATWLDGQSKITFVRPVRLT